MATSVNAELLACRASAAPMRASSAWWRRARWPTSLLVDGDPIANIRLIENPDNNFMVIMKDGNIYKNRLR